MKFGFGVLLSGFVFSVIIFIGMLVFAGFVSAIVVR